MRNFAIMFVGLLIFSCEKKLANQFSTEHFCTVIEINNKGLKEVLYDYSLENLPDEGVGVIMVDFSKNDITSSFVVYSSLSVDLKKTPPSFYAILEKVPVLFYTGLESHILLNRLYLDNLYKDVSPFLEQYIEDKEGNILQVPPSYNPAVWRIEFERDSLVKIDKLN